MFPSSNVHCTIPSLPHLQSTKNCKILKMFVCFPLTISTLLWLIAICHDNLSVSTVLSKLKQKLSFNSMEHSLACIDLLKIRIVCLFSKHAPATEMYSCLRYICFYHSLHIKAKKMGERRSSYKFQLYGI